MYIEAGFHHGGGTKCEPLPLFCEQSNIEICDWLCNEFDEHGTCKCLNVVERGDICFQCPQGQSICLICKMYKIVKL